MSAAGPRPTETLSADVPPSSSPAVSKRALKRRRTKQHKRELREQTRNQPPPSVDINTDDAAPAQSLLAEPDDTIDATLLSAMQHVLDNFNALRAEDDDDETDDADTNTPTLTAEERAVRTAADSGDDEADETRSLSALPRGKKAQKAATRLSVAELKQLVADPSLVDLHDPNSADPKLLIALKAVPHAVPVPAHWQNKRKYLQGKRGYEKPSFQLPHNIAATGIGDIRDAVLSKDADTKSKARQRDRIRPKLGAFDIDYQTLHDAFFKPPRFHAALTRLGDVYYEGKENESVFADVQVGIITSQRLREMLGMSDGPTAPPPWIYAMQRYGPPPSYAGMRIPGVTAPIPAGARWGLAHGEWGKPPVDANDHPLWGGQLKGEINAKRRKHHRTTLFGQIQETENETAPLEADETETNAAATHSANAEVTRDQSIAVADTDQSRSIAGQSAVNLRRESEVLSASRPLYSVLEERPVHIGAQLMSTQHTYVMPSAVPTVIPLLQDDDGNMSRRDGGDVHIALTPEELDRVDAEIVKRKYNETIQDATGITARKSAVEADITAKKRKIGADESKKKKEKFKL